MDCMIVGVGGQGAVLASRLIGNAAISLGFEVRGSETIGMAQRGGSIVSHVRIGEDAYSPMISPGGADLMLAFELCEAARSLPYLKTDGIMVVCDRSIQPAGSPVGYDGREILAYLRESVSRIYVPDSVMISAECGARFLNMAILGAAVSIKALPFSINDIEKAIAEKFDDRLAETNIKALRFGAAMSLSNQSQKK